MPSLAQKCSEQSVFDEEANFSCEVKDVLCCFQALFVFVVLISDASEYVRRSG